MVADESAKESGDVTVEETQVERKTVRKKVAAVAKRQAGGPGRPMTLDGALKRVRRNLPVLRDGKPTGDIRQASIKPDEVLDWREYADRVVVTTKDGHKYVADK